MILILPGGVRARLDLGALRGIAWSVAFLILALGTLSQADSASPAPFSGAGASSSNSGSARFDEPSDAVHSGYLGSIKAFRAEIPRFETAASTLTPGPKGEASLRQALHRLRDAYKRMEFLVEYLNPSSALLINGPPLDKADDADRSSKEIIKPQGLQVLEETVYDSRLPASRSSLLALTAQLSVASADLAHQAASLTPDDRMVFESMEGQVIRVLTLGISGFDSPAAQRSIVEARVSLLALADALKPYQPALRRRNAVLAKRLENALDLAAGRLGKHPDFQSFDRLGFLREAGNPLYAALIDAHLALGIATRRDLALSGAPVNPIARGLFNREFLDPHAYSNTQQETPNAEVASLGRLLFFDPVLSGDASRSCASCHQPDKGFSDGRPKSLAFGNGAGSGAPTTVQRNSPGIAYAAFQSAQFWDTRARFLEEQVGHVVTSDREFRTDFTVILGKLRSSPEYVARFRKAFPADPGDPVTVGAFTKSLAMYIRSLAKWNSPFDRYMRGDISTLEPAAARGFNLFMGKAACGTCHFPPTFNGTRPPHYLDTETEVLGIPQSADTLHPVLDPDPGRYHKDPSPVHRNAFKTPTVRNAAATGPYMHNGAFATLEELMHFYNAGGGKGLGLDVPNQTLPPDSLGLTQGEIGDIIAFMHSLTDSTGTSAPDPILPEFPGRPELNRRVVGGKY